MTIEEKKCGNATCVNIIPATEKRSVGRPKKFCCKACCDSTRDIRRANARIGAHIRLQKRYHAAKSTRAQYKILMELSQRYITSVKIRHGSSDEFSPYKPLPPFHCEALTNNFLFGDLEDVLNPLSKKYEKPINKIFQGHFYNTYGCGVYDYEAISALGEF